MEISSIITGLVVAALIFVPFIMMAYSGNKDLKLSETVFLDTTVKEGLTILKKEIIHDTLMGIDNSTNKALFVRVTKGKSEIKIINLTLIKSLSFVSPDARHKNELSQNNAYFSFVSNNGSMEQKVYVYNAIEHKPIVLAEIGEKGKRWEEILKKKLINPSKPNSPNLRKSA
jgi:hypothetical protein